MSAIPTKGYVGQPGRNEYFSSPDELPYYIDGLDGNDFVGAYSANDLLYGGLGRDVVYGDLGDDTLYGDQSAFDETRDVDPTQAAAADAIFGGSGNDVVFAGGGNNFVSGSSDADVIWGGSGNELLQGGSGNDSISGAAGNDKLFGGTDTEVNQDAFLDANFGTITLTFNGITDDPLFTPDTVSPKIYTGEVLSGTGTDTLDGGAGNDTLDGQDGADTMTGGIGNDIFTVDNAGDKVKEAVSEGTDSVRSSISLTLPANVETLTLTGSAAISGSGNAANNSIVGNTGGNILTGFGGLDTLIGGGGADRFVFRTLSDSTVATTGRDSVRDFSHAQGDHIDLHYLDAKTTVSGDQAFAFIGAAAFGHHAGELRAVTSGTTTIVSGDVNGDAAADFSILVNKTTFVAADFIL